MASSSTSPIHRSCKYDVFLSFRGKDTRKNFIDHLYHALQRQGIFTYKDDKRITKGKRICDELIRSIEDSKFHIIVFSRNYASSSWCLDELVKIMECHNDKTTEHTAYPVFYDVAPTEIRHQRGAVRKAFAKHKNKEAAGKWREALKEAADLAGWELKNTVDGHEAKFIQEIVERVSLELCSINCNFDEKLVGMETRVNDLVSSLEIGIDDVRMIGIKGMGGGGKTTLARAVFDQISCQFEGKSFVENVREVSHASLSGLKSLQNQVLSDIFNDQGIAITVSSVSDGKNMMKRMMHAKKVLIVLDDVDHMDQLEALVGDPNWFRPGSRIIITTRDEQVLVAKKVKVIHNVNLLSDKEAICLFSRYAFERDIPIHGYEELSGQVVRYAAGLPLTITILGSLLCGKNESEWIDTLERLNSIPLLETLKKLELSYIGLEEDYREIFLDVACILRGWPNYLAIEALESCGFHARNGLRALEQKSLITIDDHYYDGECVGMHDHIEEMGKDIVRRSHPNNPKKRSRLWIDDEVEDILVNDLGTKATRCIRFDARELNPDIVMKGLRKMKKLRLLDLQMGFTVANRSGFYWNSNNDFPNALRYIRWNNYPFRSLPKAFQANTLVGLGMAHSRIVQLWEAGERKVLNKLRFLDLSYSMLRTFDLGLFPNLEALTLRGCVYLVELYMPIRCLKLRSFHLGNSKLNTFDFGMTPNLQTLVLDECNDLVELQMPGRYLYLRSLTLNGSKNLRTFEIGRTPNLECLDIQNCYDLEELHMTDECQKLASLNISFSKLRTVDLGLSPNLKKLDLKYNYSLVELHTAIGCLKKLIYLDLSGCFKFTSFFFHIKDDTSYSVDESDEVSILSELHQIAEFLERCQFWYNKSLTEFQFTCFYNEYLTTLTRNLEKTVSVHLRPSTKLARFSGSICGLRRLRKLKLKSNIPEAPNDIGLLESLEELSLSSSKIKRLPDSICMLKNLKSLKIKSCSLLEMVPEDIGQLESLETLTLSSTNIKHLPNSICMLKHLESLKLIDCSLLEKLPEDIGLLECLEKLILMDCMLLRDIPHSIGKMKHLKLFYICYCIRVETLPEELGDLESLKELDIEGTCITHLPQSILSLKDLHIIGSGGLLQSYGFTSELQNSICETYAT